MIIAVFYHYFYSFVNWNFSKRTSSDTAMHLFGGLEFIC